MQRIWTAAPASAGWPQVPCGCTVDAQVWLSYSVACHPEGGWVLRHRGDMGTSFLCPVAGKPPNPQGLQDPPPPPHKNVSALCSCCRLQR